MKRLFLRKRTKKAVSLGDLEKVVMDVLWAEAPLSGREVHARVCRHHKVALTTVLTILERLQKKGMVKKEGGKKVYIFRPLISQAQWRNSLVCEYLRQALNLSPEAVMAHFAEILSELPEAEFTRLVEAIKERKRHEEMKR
jgi:predicted transcriptional regulator